MCIPLLGDTQKGCGRMRKREVWGWGSLWRRWQQDHYCSSNFHLSLIPPPTCTTYSLNPLLSVYTSDSSAVYLFYFYSHHEFPFQAFSQIHLLYCSVCHQLSVSFFFLHLKDCHLEQGTITRTNSLLIFKMQMHSSLSLKCHRTFKVGGTNTCVCL